MVVPNSKGKGRVMHLSNVGTHTFPGGSGPAGTRFNQPASAVFFVVVVVVVVGWGVGGG